MHIKICKVNNIHTARLCGNIGVNMIGLHAIKQLKKCNIEPYRMISNEVKRYYPKTSLVLVTKITDIQKLIDILDIIGVDFIQIYILNENNIAILNEKLDKLELYNSLYDVNIEQKKILEELVQKFINIKNEIETKFNRKIKFILTIPVIGINIKFTEYIIESAKKIFHSFLLDTSVVGGTGRTADIKKIKILLKKTYPINTFIAGGLNPENVQSIVKAIDSTNLCGVDVQSGVIKKVKNHGKFHSPQLIVDFFSRVHNKDSISIKRKAINFPKSRNVLISWAITDIQITQNTQRIFSIMQQTNIDTIHIDFSDGTIAPNFIKMPFDLLEHFTYYCPCINYDIHLFVKDVEIQQTIIKECLKKNMLLKTIFFHVLPTDITLLERLDTISTLCKKLNLNLGLAIQSTQFTPQTLDKFYQVVLNRKNIPLISEISLITHSRHHSLTSAVNHDKTILNSIIRNNKLYSIHALISIDRDINLEKVNTLIQTECVNQIIIGKDINSKIDLLLSNNDDNMIICRIQNHINQYRRLLKNAKRKNKY